MMIRREGVGMTMWMAGSARANASIAINFVTW